MIEDQIFATPKENKAAEAGFIHDAGLAEAIRSTNLSHDEAQSLSADFYELVRTGLTEQQTASYEGIKNSNTRKYYEKVGTYYGKQLQRLAEAIAKREAVLNLYKEELEAIDAEAEQVALLAPGMAEQARQLADTKKAEYISSIEDAQEIGQEIEQIRLTIEAIEEKYYGENSAMPSEMPLPQTLLASALAIRETSASSPEQAPEAAAATKERQPLVISMRLGVRMLRIGQKRRNILYSNNREDQVDYAELRRKALIYLLENQDREVTPQEIWEYVHDGNAPEVDIHAMVQIRVWLLEKLTIRRGQHLIVHNGKRGKGSKYHVNPDVRINFVVDKTDGQEAEGEGSHGYVPLGQPEKAFGAEVQEEDLVNIGDLAMAANHLAGFNSLLEGYNCLLPEEIVADLRQYMPDLTHIVKAHNGQRNHIDEAIWAYRKGAIARFEEIFSDLEGLFVFLDQAGQDSPQYAFVNWVMKLDNNQPGLNQLNLVTKLLKSRVEYKPIIDGRRTVLGTQPKYLDEFDREIVLPEDLAKFYVDGTPIEQKKPQAAKPERAKLTSTEAPATKEQTAQAAEPQVMEEDVIYPVGAAEVTEPVDEKNIELAGVEVAEPTVEPAVKKAAPEAKDSKMFEWEDKFRKDLALILDRIWEDKVFSLQGDGISLSLLGKRSKSTRVGSMTAIHELRKNGYMKEKDVDAIINHREPITRVQVVLLYMQKSAKEVIGQKASKPARVRGLEIIEQAIETFIEHKKQELAAAPAK